MQSNQIASACSNGTRQHTAEKERTEKQMQQCPPEGVHCRGGMHHDAEEQQCPREGEHCRGGMHH